MRMRTTTVPRAIQIFNMEADEKCSRDAFVQFWIMSEVNLTFNLELQEQPVIPAALTAFLLISSEPE